MDSRSIPVKTQNAVLMLVFNRPHLTQRVFDEVRRVRPPRLYVAGDGPRLDNPNDLELTRLTRAIFDQVDWPCELHTRFLDQNFGCRLGVSSGITWFFEHEEQGIILEDDVLPIQEFFVYCDEMLKRYADERQVMSVSGCNLIRPWYEFNTLYGFSRYMCVWGWASWRRAWQHYDEKISDWPVTRLNGFPGGHVYRGVAKYFWRQVFDLVYSGNIGTWDHQWVYAHWRKSAFTIIPSESLIVNLGFGEDATHTAGGIPEFQRRMRVKSLDRSKPVPASSIMEDLVFNELIIEKAYNVNPFTVFKLKLRQYNRIHSMIKRLVRKFN